MYTQEIQFLRHPQRQQFGLVQTQTEILALPSSRSALQPNSQPRQSGAGLLLLLMLQLVRPIMCRAVVEAVVAV